MKDNIEVTGVVSMAAPVGEYDKRLILLTRELGRITVFASGCRKPTSPFLAVCRPFTFARFTLYQGKSAYRLQGAEIVEHFDEIVKDFDAVTYGTYFLELGGYFSEENVQAEELVNLIYVSCKALLKPALSKRLVRMIFELRVLVINGEAPQVFQCVSCGKPLKEGSFIVKKHGIGCRDCFPRMQGETEMSPAAVYAMQFIETAPLSRLYTFSLAEEILQILERCMKQYYSYYIGHHFQALDMLLE